MKTKKTKDQICEYVLENWQYTWRKHERHRVEGAAGVELDRDLSEWHCWERMRQFLGLKRRF